MPPEFIIDTDLDSDPDSDAQLGNTSRILNSCSCFRMCGRRIAAAVHPFLRSRSGSGARGQTDQRSNLVCHSCRMRSRLAADQPKSMSTITEPMSSGSPALRKDSGMVPPLTVTISFQL